MVNGGSRPPLPRRRIAADAQTMAALRRPSRLAVLVAEQRYLVEEVVAGAVRASTYLENANERGASRTEADVQIPGGQSLAVRPRTVLAGLGQPRCRFRSPIPPHSAPPGTPYVPVDGRLSTSQEPAAGRVKGDRPPVAPAHRLNKTLSNGFVGW
jgi:hypothetical protein